MIKEFQGEYRWLSNFAPVEITLYGRTYRSVEHAYMSAKSDDIKWKAYCSGMATPGEVKKASRNIVLKDNWEGIKETIMRICLEQKYSTDPYKSMLLNTGTEHIQEGNRWGDKFWGVDLRTGTGDNRLGKMIMAIRTKHIPPNED